MGSPAFCTQSRLEGIEAKTPSASQSLGTSPAEPGEE